MRDFVLRRADDGDLDAIMALEAEGFPPGIREKREVFAQRLRIFPAGFLLLCRPAGEIVGYFCSERWPRRQTVDVAQLAMNHDIAASHCDTGAELYVSSMTVHPACRGNGIGAGFFAAALNAVATLPGIVSVLLMVNAEWSAARQIYAKQGFDLVGRLPDFFHPSGSTAQDALLMRAATATLRESVYR